MTHARRLSPDNSGETQKAAQPLGRLTGRYTALRERLSDMLGRGDRDYSTLTVLSQEIGRTRQRIRQKLERRRQEREERRNRHNATQHCKAIAAG